MNRTLSEKQFQSQVLDLARLSGFLCYHTFDSRRSVPGFPDIVLVRPPTVIFAELKTETGHVRPEQAAWDSIQETQKERRTHFMSEETASYVSSSQAPASKPYRENGRPKGMLPSTWTNRRVRIEYTDASGEGQSACGVLLDYFPAGPIFAMNGGARTLIVWERLSLLELAEG